MADNKPCDVLGVRMAFDGNSQYKKLKTEPDNNSEVENMFKEVDEAYKILFKPETKLSYHNEGQNTMHEEAYNNFERVNTFSHIFEGGLFSMYGDGRMNISRRGEDTIFPLTLNLEDAYNGRIFKLQFNKRVICENCRGLGSKVGHTQKCHTCGGCGQKMLYHQVAPWMTQEMQCLCPRCQGKGRIVTKWDLCLSCRGKQVCDETKELEVCIEKGMPKNKKIIFQDEGHQQPDMFPGNVVIILEERPHKYFHRSGDDLYMKHTISLSDALCGFSFSLRHLDGRDIIVTHPAGEVIKPGDVKVIVGEGMPHYKNPFEKGDLFVTFEVKFPERCFTTESNLKALETLLPAKTPFVMPEADLVEEKILEDLNNDASDED